MAHISNIGTTSFNDGSTLNKIKEVGNKPVILDCVHVTISSCGGIMIWIDEQGTLKTKDTGEFIYTKEARLPITNGAEQTLTKTKQLEADYIDINKILSQKEISEQLSKIEAFQRTLK
jgi:hypothetical protein